MDNTVVWVVMGAGLFMVMVSIISKLRSDIVRINVTLSKIAKQVGVPDIVTDEVKDELKSLVTEGQKIRAIKRYRMVTGLGLKESKEYVDSLGKQEVTIERM